MLTGMNYFIEEPLVKEHDLNDSETDKLLLDAEDFLEMLRCHQVTDTNSFPHQYQGLQVANTYARKTLGNLMKTYCLMGRGSFRSLRAGSSRK